MSQVARKIEVTDAEPSPQGLKIVESDAPSGQATPRKRHYRTGERIAGICSGRSGALIGAAFPGCSPW